MRASSHVPVRVPRKASCQSRRQGAADWKRAACALEARSRTPRAVNVDPGYVDGARLVLASTKDHAHRIWLRDGIYAEVTLHSRFRR